MLAYLHFVQISPVETALAVTKAKAGSVDRAAYLEELIVRRTGDPVLHDLAVRLLPLGTTIRPIRKLLDESPLSS